MNKRTLWMLLAVGIVGYIAVQAKKTMARTMTERQKNLQTIVAGTRG